MKKKTTIKQPEILMTVPVREVYIHKYVGKVQPVDVAVFIDYKKGIITLIDGTSDMNTPLSVKKWVFADRTIEYMAGWCDILDAMKEAVLAAKGRLSIYQKERELEQAMMMQKVAENIQLK